MSLPPRARGVKVLKAVSSPLRLQILNLFFDKGSLSYTELMNQLKMNPSRDAGRFAYHLKFLLKANLVEVDSGAKKYYLTDLGKMVIDVADRVENGPGQPRRLDPPAAAGAVMAIAIWQLLERTRLGLLIRATSQNAEMVHALGIDVGLVRSGVFGIGCGLAALGGVLAAPLVTASHGMAASVIIDAFVIVIIGGMGSFLGSLIGALLIAFVQVFGNYYLPDFALAFMYLVMLLVLVVRPGGLLGKEA